MASESIPIRVHSDGHSGIAQALAAYERSQLFVETPWKASVQGDVLAISQLGPDKGDGDTKVDDFGRFRETGQPGDLYAFRTPSLLNVTVTVPMGTMARTVHWKEL